MRLKRLSKETEQDKPPSCSRPQASWLVAVVANLKGDTPLPVDGPPDAGAEFDRNETIQTIREAIESGGHRTVFIPADAELPFALREIRPDICFNIAEGMRGESREAQVPALLELLGIPYTASRVQANAVSLDKTMTKRLWREAGLPIARYQEIECPDERLRSDLQFPLFVKPAREGTGMGVDMHALVREERELRERVAYVVEHYHQPALVETFLPGREFTVGVMGRPDAALYSPHPELYDASGFHHFPIVEVDNGNSVTPGIYSYKAKTKDLWENGAPGIHCPAAVDPRLAMAMQKLALRAHQAIGALDISRVDIRLDAQGKPCLIEINTLPGLTPDFSDLCIMTNAEGLPYRDLILEILYLGASRFQMMNVQISLPARVAARARQPIPARSC